MPTHHIPNPPPDCELFCQDAAGYPCGTDKAVIWTYEHAPCWFNASEFPVPKGRSKTKERATKKPAAKKTKETDQGGWA